MAALFQRKLESFFTVKIHHFPNKKRCFIYDPALKLAFFASIPDDTDQYITTKSDIKLYYRKPTKQESIGKKMTNFKIKLVEAPYNIPLLKSNLQKAIRRKHRKIAVTTALAILQQDMLELLRRLPIIYIEDVCMMDSYPIIVWLMMADKEYMLEVSDIEIILNIIAGLCDTDEIYDFPRNPTILYSHEELEEYPNADILLSLYYRSQYGGMKGDMIMLNNAIYYYSNKPIIPKTDYSTILDIDDKVEILEEAIDFHPYPYMLIHLSKMTNIDQQDIKKAIWFMESGLNLRKPETLEIDESIINIFKKIQPFLKEIREIFLEKSK